MQHVVILDSNTCTFDRSAMLDTLYRTHSDYLQKKAPNTVMTACPGLKIRYWFRILVTGPVIVIALFQ